MCSLRIIAFYVYIFAMFEVVDYNAYNLRSRTKGVHTLWRPNTLLTCTSKNLFVLQVKIITRTHYINSARNVLLTNKLYSTWSKLN